MLASNVEACERGAWMNESIFVLAMLGTPIGRIRPHIRKTASDEGCPLLQNGRMSTVV